MWNLTRNYYRTWCWCTSNRLLKIYFNIPIVIQKNVFERNPTSERSIWISTFVSYITFYFLL